MSTSSGWIGARPVSAQIGAILAVGVTGVMMTGLQPLLLGLLAQEGRITVAQLGHAATAELLVMGAASAFAGACWRAERLRAIGALSALLLAVFNIATLGVSGEAVTLVRALAGLPSGVLIWITIAMIARSPMPERWAGIYMTLQTFVQFVIAAALTAWITPDFGSNGGFLAVALICGITAITAVLLPNRFVPLGSNDTNYEMPSGRGLVALAVAVLWMAFAVGVWVYLEPLTRQAGHRPGIADAAISVSLACQVLGGLAATLLAGRVRWFPILVGCAVLDIACLLAFAMMPGEASLLMTASLFGFLWLFALPFVVPMVIAADPTRRAAVLVGGAQLLGGSIGPLLVSFVVTDTDVRGALAVGAIALVMALVIVFALHFRERGALDAVAET